MKRLIAGGVAAGIAIFGGAGAMDDDTTRDDSGEIIESGGLGVLAIQPGDCLQVPVEELVQSLEAVPCDIPHDAQAFANVTLRDGPFRGELAVQQESYEACETRFEAFVGTEYAESELWINALYPVEEGWDQGDHMATCLLVSGEEGRKLTGDLEGSGI